MTRIVRATRDRSRRWLALPLLAVVAITLVLVQGAFSQPRASAVRAHTAKPATQSALACGQTVTGSVSLTADLTGCAGHGLVVGANGTSINLNGHTISGPGTAACDPAPVECSGVYNDHFTGVSVKNGAITGFIAGVQQFGAGSITVSGMRIYDNTDTGIWINAGTANLTSNVVNHNGFLNGVLHDGFTDNGIEVDPDATSAVLTGNHALSNAQFGFFINTQHVATLTGNIANGNAESGFWLWPSSKPNAGDASLTPIKASGNKAFFNTKLGFDSGAGVVDLGKNTAGGNGTAHQCENIICSP
jgi:hypothetical protein